MVLTAYRLLYSIRLEVMGSTLEKRGKSRTSSEYVHLMDLLTNMSTPSHAESLSAKTSPADFHATNDPLSATGKVKCSQTVA